MREQATAESLTDRASWHLRTRLALALIAVLLPISVLIAVSHIEDLRDRRTTRVESFATIDETIAAVVSGFVNDLQSFSLSTAIALGDSDLPLDQQTVGPYMMDLARSYGILRSVFVTDLNGIVLAGTSGNVGFDVSSRDYVKALQGGADTVWSGALAGSESGQTTVAYGRVIRNQDGTPRAYLFIAFYPSLLATRLPADLPPDANISLIDSKGLVLYTSRPQDDAAAAASPAPLDVSSSSVFAAAHAGQQVLVKSDKTPVDQDKRYGAFVSIPNPGWVVGFTRPAAAVDGPLNSRFKRDLLVIGGLLLAGFATMLFIASRLSRPLSTLAAAAAAIARGERAVVPIATADADVRQLETAMDSMSRAVAQREERLQAQARVLETLDRVGNSLATELDFDQAVASIAQAALDVTSAEQTALFQKQEGEEGVRLLSLAGASGEFPLDVSHPMVEKALEGAMVRVSDLEAQPEQNVAAGSLLGIPITSRAGQTQGSLFLLSSRPRAFDDNQERLAVGLARRAGIVMENASLYSEARAVQEQLRQANTAKDEFIGVMSHELRTPITTIYGGARLLQTRRKNLPEDAVDEMITSIEEESERLYRLVENLLAIARTDLGYEFAKEIISVESVIDQVVKQFANRHATRPIELDVQPDLPPALGEASYLHQVLNNLISNADKYSEAGRPIDVVARATRHEIEIHVLDRGPGVPAEELAQIFESFYRSQRTARQATGKGLGLTVCKRLMEAMNGRIWAQAREGGGLEVAVALPLAAEDLPDDEPIDLETP